MDGRRRVSARSRRGSRAAPPPRRLPMAWRLWAWRWTSSSFEALGAGSSPVRLRRAAASEPRRFVEHVIPREGQPDLLVAHVPLLGRGLGVDLVLSDPDREERRETHGQAHCVADEPAQATLARL